MVRAQGGPPFRPLFGARGLVPPLRASGAPRPAPAKYVVRERARAFARSAPVFGRARARPASRKNGAARGNRRPGLGSEREPVQTVAGSG
eukprot:scaffold106_cov380-Prasinococcus_capsulatus_cf.AAC.17